MEYLELNHSQIYPWEEDKEMLALQKTRHLKLKPFFPCPSAILTFSSLTISGMLGKRVVSHDEDLKIF